MSDGLSRLGVVEARPTAETRCRSRCSSIDQRLRQGLLRVTWSPCALFPIVACCPIHCCWDTSRLNWPAEVLKRSMSRLISAISIRYAAGDAWDPVQEYNFNLERADKLLDCLEKLSNRLPKKSSLMRTIETIGAHYNLEAFCRAGRG